MQRLLAGAAVVVLLLTGCGHKKKHVRVTPPPPPPTPTAAPKVGDTETGVASWYGHPYHGRAAADGEIYDMETMTAAHRTLPFNTWVRVHNLDNGKSVDVRIIDRGPFVAGRIIDVSHAAARQIEMIGPGTAKVRVEIVKVPELPEKEIYAVQVGAFRDRGNAERVLAEMSARYGSAKLVPRQGTNTVWRVLVGAESTPQAAEELARKIREEGNEKSSAFVVRLDSV